MNIAARALHTLQQMTSEQLAAFPTVQDAARAAQEVAEDCIHCRGTGTCDEAPRTALGHDGRNVCSGGSFPCPECYGTGEVRS